MLLPVRTTENPPVIPALSSAYLARIWYFPLKLWEERKACQNTKAWVLVRATIKADV